MAAKINSRTVAPDGQAIQRLRHAKGWNAQRLADKAGFSLKTVENAERGNQVYPVTLKTLAQALGVEVQALLLEPLPPPQPKQRTWEITIKISTPYEEFDQSNDLTRLFSTLIERLGGVVVEPEEVRKGNPNITFPGDGTSPRTAEFLRDLHQKFGGEPQTVDDEGTRIHFFATGYHIRRVLEAYKDGGLDDLGITRIWVLYVRLISSGVLTHCRFGGNRTFCARYFPTMIKRVRRFLGDGEP